ncbi:cytochrome P450 [Streptomyces sp. NPDC020794]|uniref:cytochrome P450 n=1 Tax=unclassified Streptomyces TaxID=2593676 RepID=UPI0036EA57A9
MTPDPARPPLAPGSLPLLGHLPALAHDPLGFFARLPDHGPLVRIRLGARQAYVVNRPDLVRRLLTAEQTAFDKGGPFYDKARLVGGNGLATCPAADHARQRPALQPAFHPSRFTRYAETMSECAARMCDSWEPGRLVSLTDEVGELASLVISRTLFAAPEGQAAATQVAQAFPVIARAMFWRMLIPGERFARLPLPVNRRFSEQMTLMRQAVDDLITHYRHTGEDHGDLFSMIISGFGDDPDPATAIRDQVFSLLVAGMETSVSSVVGMLRLLDAHPAEREKVVNELDDVLHGRPPTREDVPRLPLMHNALTETLRLYPPGWIFSRITTRPVDWDEGHLAVGSDVFISPYALHRTPEIFPRPDSFDPDRWKADRAGPAQREGFFGFGAGRRKCIGDTFGMTFAVISVATILNRWHLHHQPGRSGYVPRFALNPPPTLVIPQPPARKTPPLSEVTP